MFRSASNRLHALLPYCLAVMLVAACLPFSAWCEAACPLAGHPCINAESDKTIHGEPDPTARVIGTLQQQTIFQVVAEKNGWLKILLQDAGASARSSGWISREGVRRTSYLDGAETAVVHNPDPADRLHLRAKPKVSSQSLGKYYNGAVVAVLDDHSSSEWTKVRIGTLVGYMQARYLESGAAAASVMSARPGVMVSNGSGKGLHLREYPRITSASQGLYANGTQALVLGLTEQWYHVQIGDEFGFMSAHGIRPRLPYSRSADAPSSGTGGSVRRAVVTCELCMYQYDSENSLEVITTLPTGETVSVLSSGSNGWSRVSNGIREGYVRTQYLKFE